jgi:hypothetical protein
MPEYYIRVSTVCPGGISPQFSSFLQTPLKKFGPQFNMRNYLGIMLLKSYQETKCPFCCTIIGWASKEYDPQLLFTFLNPLEQIQVTKSNKQATVVGFAFDVGYAIIKILGVWPFVDLFESEAAQEYNKYCFKAKPEICDGLLEWSHATFVAETCKTDPIGVVYAVIATSEDIVDSKMDEILRLLNEGANKAFQ